jgi:hypothetical protein
MRGELLVALNDIARETWHQEYSFRTCFVAGILAEISMALAMNERIHTLWSRSCCETHHALSLEWLTFSALARSFEPLVDNIQTAAVETWNPTSVR